MYLPHALPISLGNDPVNNHLFDEVISSIIAGQSGINGVTGPIIPLPEHDKAYARQILSAYNLYSPVPEEIALIVSTSGTTGTPKGSLLSYAALEASAQASAQAMGGQGAWLLAIPGYHIAGINVVYRSLYAGYSPYRMDLSQGFSVDEFIRAATTFAPHTPRYTSLVPTQLYKIMRNPRAVDALAGFDGVLIGGAPTTAECKAQVTEANISAYYSYGMSETCGGCVYNGIPLAGVHIQLLPDTEIGTTSTDIGRISIQGPMVAEGYYNIPDHIAFSQPNWYISNDIGQFIDGELHVQGRIDHIANISGIKINPQLIAETLANQLPTMESTVFAVPHNDTGECLVAVFRENSTPLAQQTIDQIAAHIRDNFGYYAIPRYWISLSEFPLIGPGKIDYTTLTHIVESRICAQEFYSVKLR